MSDEGFKVTFRGDVLDGWDPDEVKMNMAQLFKLDHNTEAGRQVLEKMFSGKQVIIKAGLKRPEAESYIEAIAGAGGEANLDPRDVPPPGVSERRVAQRRRRGDRRQVARLSSISPDRRASKGRRHSDPQIEN